MIISHEQLASIAKTLDAEMLPGDLSEIAELIGIYKSLLISVHVNGYIYLARWTSDPNGWSKDMAAIVGVVGVDDAARIARYFNGSHINIPLCTNFWRQARNRSILAASGGDYRQLDIARTHNISERHLRRIQRRAAIRAKQPKLF